MGFTTNDSRVEVNLFKPSGKWYAQASVDMKGLYEGKLLHEAFLAACIREFELGAQGQWGLSRSPREYLAEGWMLVCLSPHHEHSHPILLRATTTDDVPTSAPDEPRREYRLKALLTLLYDQKARDEAAQLFHQAWGNAANGHYDKPLWGKLQSIFGM